MPGDTAAEAGAANASMPPKRPGRITAEATRRTLRWERADMKKRLLDEGVASSSIEEPDHRVGFATCSPGPKRPDVGPRITASRSVERNIRRRRSRRPSPEGLFGVEIRSQR